MPTYQRIPQGVFYDHQQGRLMEHIGYSKRIFWTKDMLDYLRYNFATTLNEELAGCIGVSQRTMIRKARELGLKKNPEWLAAVWEERRKEAHIISKSKGYPGGFVKGQRAYPAGEFKPGHRLTDEQEEKKREGMRQWCRKHPAEVRARAAKAWVTRRKRMAECAES